MVSRESRVILREVSIGLPDRLNARCKNWRGGIAFATDLGKAAVEADARGQSGSCHVESEMIIRYSSGDVE